MTSAPADYWCDYTILSALAAHESVWRGEYLLGKIPEAGARAQEIVAQLMAASKSGAAALPFLQTC